MSPEDRPSPAEETSETTTAEAVAPEHAAADVAEDKEKRKLALDVQIETVGPCKRHIQISIPREDIEAQYSEAFDELVENAAVPGFRPGHAPRRLIERRFRKEVADQVKGSLLMASLEQVSDEHKLAVISEPDLDPSAIELPDEGPMLFEFDVEVRPEFELPDYKGLTVKRPVREITDDDVEKHTGRFLSQFGKLVPKEGPAGPEDYASVDLSFYNGDQLIKEAKEQVLQLRPTLRFLDGTITGFDKLMKGVQAGETRETTLTISPNAASPLRGSEVRAVFHVNEVKQMELPKLTPEFLDHVGFDSEDELRDEVRASLKHRLEYEQRRIARQQVLQSITGSADWELPEDLLRRQANSALRRQVLEMRRAGYTDQEIRAREAQLQQNSLASTAQSLKELFVLEKIAEEEKIEVEPDDLDAEMAGLAARTGESVRRIRARLTKEGMLESLATQILERKALDRVLEYASYEDIPYEEEPDAGQVEALDQAAGGEEPQEGPPTETPDDKD
jgi:trigger factor